MIPDRWLKRRASYTKFPIRFGDLPATLMVKHPAALQAVVPASCRLVAAGGIAS